MKNLVDYFVSHHIHHQHCWHHQHHQHLGYWEGQGGSDEHEELGQPDRSSPHCQPVSRADCLETLMLMVTMRVMVMVIMVTMMRAKMRDMTMSTCGMISPNTTIPRVAPMTATSPPPPVNVSSKIVKVLFTLVFEGHADDTDDGGDQNYQHIAQKNGAEEEVAHSTNWHDCLSLTIIIMIIIISMIARI